MATFLTLITGSAALFPETVLRPPCCLPSRSPVITMLPSASEDFREQIKQGLAGDEGASLKARLVLPQCRDMWWAV